MKKRVQAGWNGWRRMSGVICDRRVPARVKGSCISVDVIVNDRRGERIENVEGILYGADE